MTLLDRLRNLFSSPPHVHDTTDDAGEVERALSEEYDAPEAHDASLRRMEEGLNPAGSEAAGAAVDDLGSLEAPTDPDP
jgi:hypothetical protein